VFVEGITAFEEAETKAATRAKGAASFRDAKKKKVKDDLFIFVTTFRASWRRRRAPPTRSP
jgi:hypothetical protein